MNRDMKKFGPCCRTCAHYNLEATMDRAGRVRRNSVGACLWKTPPLPDSVVTYGGRGKTYELPRRMMTPDDGKLCRTWEERQ